MAGGGAARGMRFIGDRGFRGLEKLQDLAAQAEAVPVPELLRMGQPAAVQIRAIAAAIIDQPEFPAILLIDAGMQAGNLGVRVQANIAFGGAAQEAAALDVDLPAAAIYEPGRWEGRGFTHKFTLNPKEWRFQ